MRTSSSGHCIRLGPHSNLNWIQHVSQDTAWFLKAEDEMKTNTVQVYVYILSYSKKKSEDTCWTGEDWIRPGKPGTLWKEKKAEGSWRWEEGRQNTHMQTQNKHTSSSILQGHTPSSRCPPLQACPLRSLQHITILFLPELRWNQTLPRTAAPPCYKWSQTHPLHRASSFQHTANSWPAHRAADVFVCVCSCSPPLAHYHFLICLLMQHINGAISTSWNRWK